MNTHNMGREVALFREIRDRIAIIYGLDGDDETLLDTTAGECGIEEAIARVIREANATKAMSAGLAELIKTMGERKARLDNKVERLRDVASWAMGETGLNKVTAPDLTASIRPGKSKIIIVAEGSLAAQFVKTITTTKPDLDAIKAAIDTGEVPEGVEIGNAPPVLTVRQR